jgi:SpoVK/Ycf46/Vps4 family AAA+-type ATPase
MGMRIQDGDSVIVDDDRDRVGIVARREGTLLKIIFRDRRMTFDRSQVEAVAQKMADAVSNGTKYSNSLSFRGRSTLGDLAMAFGYWAEQRLRGDTIAKIKNQLARAGLEVLADRDSADAVFELQPLEEPSAATSIGSKLPTIASTKAADASCELPTPFWPEALGLAQKELLRVLRALPEADPLLCLLYLPEAQARLPWLQPTWEGLVGWAYSSAQRFIHRSEFDGDQSRILRLPSASLDRYAKGSALPDENHLRDGLHRINLIALESGADERGFARLKAVWPGQVFEFRPSFASAGGEDALRALITFLYAVGGRPDGLKNTDIKKISPLDLLVWTRNTVPKLMAAAAMDFGDLVSSGDVTKFRGSNESSTALALKALAATWAHARSSARSGGVSFEEKDDSVVTDELDLRKARRVDISVGGLGVFEVETLHGSGPIEDFYHRKVFSRLDLTKKKFHLVVPSDAILWAGPYLADIAHLLGDRGRVLFPTGTATTSGDTQLGLIGVAPRRLERASVEVEEPTAVAVSGAMPTGSEEQQITLEDIAGYDDIRALVRDEVIWPRTDALASQVGSRSAGILFYGPPGCGKSRIARAICGTLGHEVRLRGPADFKGLYIGWGQHLVREQFEWLLEDEKRVLLIDEFDAIARSRHSGEMHSDEKADVNELLVQLDRASRLGRLVLGTTNFVSSLDEAVVRSGRFSHFVPVGPPDAQAAAAIVGYYLSNLGRDRTGKGRQLLSVTSPSRESLSALLTDVCGEQTRDAPWLAGADFEEAVTRTFRRALRKASAQPRGDSSEVPLRIEITEADLRTALQETRRSIAWKTLSHFLEEVGAHSPAHAEVIEASLFGGGHRGQA